MLLNLLSIDIGLASRIPWDNARDIVTDLEQAMLKLEFHLFNCVSASFIKGTVGLHTVYCPSEISSDPRPHAGCCHGL